MFDMSNTHGSKFFRTNQALVGFHKDFWWLPHKGVPSESAL